MNTPWYSRLIAITEEIVSQGLSDVVYANGFGDIRVERLFLDFEDRRASNTVARQQRPLCMHSSRLL